MTSDLKYRNQKGLACYRKSHVQTGEGKHTNQEWLRLQVIKWGKNELVVHGTVAVRDGSGWAWSYKGVVYTSDRLGHISPAGNPPVMSLRYAPAGQTHKYTRIAACIQPFHVR